MKQELVNKLIEVDIIKQSNFLVIKESLERIGVRSADDSKLFPSCLIIHSNGKYFVGHFKIGFEMNGKTSDISDSDFSRCFTVAKLLEQWGLIKIINVPFEQQLFSMKGVFIVPFNLKKNYTIVHKFQLGKGDTNATNRQTKTEDWPKQ